MVREFTARQLADYLETAEPRPFLLDVREPWEFETVKLPNSTLIPMGQIPTAINELDPDQVIVVICHHGVRSRSVAHYLDRNEFSNLINLSGGIDAWARDIDPSMPVY